MNERNYMYDNLKAFLIFSVVLGHALSRFGSTLETDTLYLIIFSFHMPAFLFVSGHFAKNDPKKLFSKILPLYIVFQLIQIFANPVMDLIETGIWKMPNIQFFKPRWTLWYLVALMLYQLLIPIFETKSKGYRIFYLIFAVVLGIGIGYTPHTENFLAISRTLVFLPFFVAGYYEKEGRFFTKMRESENRILIMLLSLITVVLITMFLAFNSTKIPVKYFFGTLTYGDDGLTWYLRLLCMGISFIWLWFLLMWTPKKRIPLLGSIGRNTLPIYLLHSIAIYILLRIPAVTDLVTDNLLWIIIISIIMTLVFSLGFLNKLLRLIKVPLK